MRGGGVDVFLAGRRGGGQVFDVTARLGEQLLRPALGRRGGGLVRRELGAAGSRGGGCDGRSCHGRAVQGANGRRSPVGREVEGQVLGVLVVMMVRHYVDVLVVELERLQGPGSRHRLGC